MAGLCVPGVYAQPLDYIPITTRNAASLTQFAALQLNRGALHTVAFGQADDMPHGVLGAAGEDGVVRLVDVMSGRVLDELSAHTAAVDAVAFQPDGAGFASGGVEQVIWSPERAPLPLSLHTEAVTALSYSADGGLLASGAADGAVILHDSTTGAELARLQNYGGAVRDVALSPDRSLMATASDDGSVWLWGLSGEPYVAVLRGHVGVVNALAFAPNGVELATAGADGTVRLWTVADERNVMTITVTDAPVTDIAYSPAGDMLAAVSGDGWMRVWRADTRSGIPLVAKRGYGSPLAALAFNAAGTLIATAGRDGVLGLWIAADASPAAAAPPAATPTLRPLPTQRPTQPAPRLAPASPVPPTATAPPPAVIRAPVTPTPQLVGASIYMPTVNIASGVRVFPLTGPTWAIDPYEPLVGHFEGTAWLTEDSNIVLGGHSELPNGAPGIFARLYNVRVGDPIIVQDGSGGQREFIVTEIRTVHYTDVSVVMPNGNTQLTLITCDIPSFDASTQLYDDRLVVIARPAA